MHFIWQRYTGPNVRRSQTLMLKGFMIKAICTEPEILHLKSTRPFFLVEKCRHNSKWIWSISTSFRGLCPIYKKVLTGGLIIHTSWIEPASYVACYQNMQQCKNLFTESNLSSEGWKIRVCNMLCTVNCTLVSCTNHFFDSSCAISALACIYYTDSLVKACDVTVTFLTHKEWDKWRCVYLF